MNVLFVCTGNIFRSVSAEYFLRKYLSENNIEGINVSSAGTISKKEDFSPEVLRILISLGVNPLSHKQRKLTKEIIEESDLIIPMTKEHGVFVKNLGGEYALFNDFIGEEGDLNDVREAFSEENRSSKEAKDFLKFVLNYLYSSMPNFYENLKKQLLSEKNV